MPFPRRKGNEKLVEPGELEQWAAEVKNSGKSLVTLNGSFDLLHAGHLQILNEAADQGDVLLVALNSDSSIQQYKSPKRPIIELKYRLQMMSALEMVDFVTWFDELDPRAWLARVRPDVHVNGAEYGSDCIERAVVEQGGGRIHVVKLVPGLSTSKIIEKIKNLS